MATWTLACDESGTFDSTEEVCLIVGGVLVPGDASSHDELRNLLKTGCRELGAVFPPHAKDIKKQAGEDALTHLRARTSDWLRERGAYFLALVSRPQGGVDPARHVRMLGSLVECAARLVSAQGGATLDLEVASRRFPLADAAAAQARTSGFSVTTEQNVSWVDGVVGAELRESVEGLRRNATGLLRGWPKVGTVAVRPATFGGSHPGVFVSDLLCNATYASLREDPSMSGTALTTRLASFEPSRVLLLDYDESAWVRRIDGALRQNPPDLATAARHQTELAIGVASNAARRAFAVTLEGPSRLTDVLMQHALPVLAEAMRTRPTLVWPCLKLLAARCELELELKHGDYAGTLSALDAAWFGVGALASGLRTACSDRELAARLWRLTLECANHVADATLAETARREFMALLRSGASLFLLAELLRVRNLTNVALQNRLPAAQGDADALLERLSDEARALKKVALDAAGLGSELGFSAEFHASDTAEGNELERALRKGVSYDEPPWHSSDREVGQCLGTAGRSLAFAGHFDEATSLLLHARARFVDSERDRRFNACVIARVEAERARVEGHARTETLRAALSLSGLARTPGPKSVVTLLETGPGGRFAFDALLRALLWAPDAFDADLKRAWETDVAKAPEGRTFSLLVTQLSHPTELVARHAAELVRSSGGPDRAANAWFELSLRATPEQDAATAERTHAFTRALFSREPLPVAPRGSVMNPAFEDR